MGRPASTDPLALLGADRTLARARQDPCANVCTLATVDAAGHPHARTVVLRDLDERLAVFINETSPKWQQIGQSASLAVVVWLPTLNVQYRLQCHTRPVARTVVHESWRLRPEAPKRLDWYYTRIQAQSSPVRDRGRLLEGIAALTLRHPLEAPRTAAGVFLEPFTVERLDLNQPEGVHDRRHFQHRPDGWHEVVLVP